jgi:hypothetical protein
LTIEETTPERTWPFCRVVRKFWRTADCVCSSQAARQHDVVAVLVELDDLGLELLPTYGLQVAHAAHLDQRRGQEAAQPMSRMRPPLTTSMTVPVTMPSSSLIFSIVPHARSYCARFLDRISRPSLSSFWRPGPRPRRRP